MADDVLVPTKISELPQGASIADAAIEISQNGSPPTSYKMPAGIAGVAAKSFVKSRVLSAPPGSPSENDRYIIAAGGSGAWAGFDNYVAEWLLNGSGAGAWYVTAQPTFMYVADEDIIAHKLGGVWQLAAPTATTIKSATTAAQPGSPTAWDIYFTGVAPTGAAWSGHPNVLATWTGSTWTFIAPKTSNTYHATDSAADYVWNGSTLNPKLIIHSSVAATLAAADAIATTLGAELWIDSNWTLGANTTLNAPIVRFCGGTITCGIYNLIVNGFAEIRSRAIILNSTGTAKFTNGNYPAIGFGIAPATTDNFALFQTLVTNVGSVGGGRIILENGLHTFSNTNIAWKSGVNLYMRIEGGEAEINWSTAAAFANSNGFVHLDDTAAGGISNTVAVSNAIAEFDGIVYTADASGFTVGDNVQVRSSEWWNTSDRVVLVTYLASTAMAFGAMIKNSSGFYVNTNSAGGTTGAASPPTGTGTNITDGTVTWCWVPATDLTYQEQWAATTAVVIGAVRVSNIGRWYVCVQAGTTGATAPTSTSTTPITDGTVKWRYLYRSNGRKGEFATVQFINTGVSPNAIYVTGPISTSYALAGAGATTFTVQISKVTFSTAKFGKGITFKGKGFPSDATLIGPDNYYNPVTLPDIGILARFATVEYDCSFVNVEQFCIQEDSCFNSVHRDHRSALFNVKHLESNQYYYYPHTCTTGTRLTGGSSINARHDYSTDGSASSSPAAKDYGIPRDIVAVNVRAENIWQAAFDTHAAGIDCGAYACQVTVTERAAAIKSRSRRSKFSGIKGVGTASSGDFTDGMISIYFDGGDIDIDGCTMEGGYMGLYIEGMSGVSSRIRVSGYTGRNQAMSGIRLGGVDEDEFDQVEFDNCQISGSGDVSLYVRGTVRRLSINAPSIVGGTYGIRTINATVTSLELSGHNLSSSTNELLYLEKVTGFNIGGGTLTHTSASIALRLRDCVGGTLGAQRITLPTSYATCAIYLNATGAGTLDRVVVAPGQQIYSPSVSGVALQCDTNATNCDVFSINTNCPTIISTGSGLTNFFEDAPQQSVTIASGSISIRRGVREVFVDTEGAASTDDLDTIVWNGVATYKPLILRANSNARTVVVKNGTGDIACNADRSLDNSNDRWTCDWGGPGNNVFCELAFADNGA